VRAGGALTGAVGAAARLLLYKDPVLSTRQVTNLYPEKDIIEKVFRTLKTSEEVVPVRHRLEWRVRAYLFVCVLAYRLLAMLQHRLRKAYPREDTWERSDTLLQELARVERVQVRLGHRVRTWYLNLGGEAQEALEKMGYKALLIESVEVNLGL
jgi:hypothetical protein